jgi:beta-N-acetylhexosaminidase
MTAATLAGLGINVNFAPVVDLATNPNNPIIAKIERSFSASPDSVSKFARIFIEEHRRLGVVNVLKHFPGHGSSKGDTHLGLVDVTQTWSDEELKPYSLLIDSCYVDAVMTAHILNKNLDAAGNPGTLSHDVIQGILRNRLKFDGVIFSDDMQMLAITKHYGFEEAIKMAVNAGVDVLTFSNNIQASQSRTVDKVHEIIRKFVDEGAISRKRIDESYRRIMRLKAQLGRNLAEELRRAEKGKREEESNVKQLRMELEQKDQLIRQLQEGNKKRKKKGH